MTNLYFSFDTEDFTSNYAADGILEMANVLKEEGIRGNFCMVGLLAEQLQAWGRSDVLDALKYHEIDFHSYGHSLHPCINEYTNVENFQEAYQEVIRQESAGIAAVKAATGVKQVYAACPPGPNESYAAMYAYSDMGIPCYVGGMVDTPDGSGAFWCNMFYLYYYAAFEWTIPSGKMLEPEYIEALAARKNVIIYNHPNRLMYNQFWDAVNFKDGINHYPFGEWKEASRMSDEEREQLRKGIREFIRKVKLDGRFKFCTFSEATEEHCTGARILKPEDMKNLKEQLEQRFYPVKEPYSLCISDIFGAAVKFLKGDKLYAAGRVYGFLDTPYAIQELVKVKAEDVKKTASNVDLRTFLPSEFMVGEIKLGPADFLFAMLGALCGDEEIILFPRPQLVDLSGLGLLGNFRMDRWMFAKDFKAEILHKRTPLQGWTLRF
ncbi:MAG: hypothetical protein IJ315_00015 [Firmicutes bacterium]|nr:hypothetical protein [Bacillota bacterium]